MSTTGYLQDSTGAYIVKDPGSTLDYIIDWTNWLGSDTVSSVSYTLASGITTSTAIGGSATSTTSTTNHRDGIKRLCVSCDPWILIGTLVLLV